MANHVANALDWYLNKLNTWHLIPANAATLLRDISAKQLGDNNFTPRPLTAENFTDAELDAMWRLAGDGKDKSVRGLDYDPVSHKGGYYGARKEGLGEYFSPLRNVSTTLGQFNVRNGKIVDTYDFNHDEVTVKKNDDGTVTDMFGNEWPSEDAYKKSFSPADGGGSAYARFRGNAIRLGHSDTDPDNQKIKAEIPLSDIRDRLGDRAGKLDIMKRMGKGEFVTKSTLAGAITGVPIGAVLGAMRGAMMLIDKNNRKRWARTMIKNILGGAALTAAVSGLGGGIASSGMWNRFEKKSEEVPKYQMRKRKNSGALLSTIATIIPLIALAGSVVAAKKKWNNITGGLLKDVDGRDNVRLFYDEDMEIYQPQPI